MRLLSGLAVFCLLAPPSASRQLTAIRVSQGQDLQAAIDAARPGDTLILAGAARFEGNFVLPRHRGAGSMITIRSEGRELPGAGVRTGPAYSGRLAVLQSPNARPALRLAPGAHHWRLENLEFRANADGYGEIIALGSGRQRDATAVPHTLVLDRLLIRGDPATGQKRAIALNSGATEIRNCHIADIKGVGMDTQAIAGWNGPGPYVIENNHLEAAGENVLFGGADPSIPDLVPSDIVVRRNLLTKPLSWRDPIVPTPGRVTWASTDGTLPADTYLYRVAAERTAGQGTTAVSGPTEAVTVVLQAPATGGVALEWGPVHGASAYRVYRQAADGRMVMWRVAEPRFADRGSPGTAAKRPERATVWAVKNLFELKNARNVVVEGNIFERNWVASQPGYAVLLQVVNQGGAAPWSTIEEVRIANNVIRHVSSAIHLVGVDQKRDSGRMRRITIENNLIVDVDRRAWRGAGDFLLMGGGAAEVTVERNTVLHTGRIISAFGGSREPRQMEGFVFRRNLVRHNQYGVKGDDVNSGRPTLDRYFPGAAFEGNVIAGGNRAHYPPRNHFPGADEFESLFVGPGDYRLKPGSRFAGVGADLDRIEEAIGASTRSPAGAATRRRSRD